MPTGGKWFPTIACHDPRSRPKIGSLHTAENHRTRITGAGLCIDRECHLVGINFVYFFKLPRDDFHLPHMINGASRSNRIGCCKNISRDFWHNPRISCSLITTDLPGRYPRTVCSACTLKWNDWKLISGAEKGLNLLITR